MKHVLHLIGLGIVQISFCADGLSADKFHGALLFLSSEHPGKKEQERIQEYAYSAEYDCLPIELKFRILQHKFLEQLPHKDQRGFKAVQELKHPTSRASSVAWHPTRPETLAFGSSDRASVRVLNIATTALQHFGGHASVVRAVAWHPTRPNALASGSDDSTVRVLNTATGRSQRFAGHVEGVNAVAWHPTRPDTLAAGSGDGTVWVWNTATGRSQQFVSPTRARLFREVRSVAWHPTRPDTLAAGSDNGTVWVWNTATGTSQQFKGHTWQVNSVAWHPTRPDVLASCSNDQTLRIWNTATNTAQVLTYDCWHVYSVAWHPTRPDTLASGAGDTTIRIWRDDNNSAALEDYFSTEKVTYEGMMVALLLVQRHVPGQPTIVLDAIREMNRELKKEFDRRDTPQESRTYTTMAAWRAAQDAFPSEVKTALNRALALRARVQQ